MRIAILRQRVSGFGGAETTVGHLIRGLAAAGHELVVLSTEPPQEASKVLGTGARHLQVPVWGKKTGRLLSFAVNSRRLAQQSGASLVFSLERTLSQHVYRAGDGCHREWLARRTPYLSAAARLAQQVSPFHRTMLWLERRLFAHPGLKSVIANSRLVQEAVTRHYGFDPAKIRLIYNGLNRERFRPLPPAERRALAQRLGAPPAAKIVLFVGSGFARKGLAYLIEAFGSLKDRQALLWVVGQGNTGPYEKLAAWGGVAERVTFWGARADVVLFYQAAAVLALPTIYDPCSNVVLEALACGVPVVTTAANGACEFLAPGENGAVLADPHEVKGLVAALNDFLSRDGDHQVRQAAMDAVAHLSWESTVSQTLAVLEEAAATSP